MEPQHSNLLGSREWKRADDLREDFIGITCWPLVEPCADDNEETCLTVERVANEGPN